MSPPKAEATGTTEAAEPVAVEDAKPADAEATPKAVPFVEPVAIKAGPTAEQRNWLANHPQYAPMAHGTILFSDRGTLHVDGTFVGEQLHPPMDGGGAISVGIPISSRRR